MAIVFASGFDVDAFVDFIEGSYAGTQSLVTSPIHAPNGKAWHTNPAATTGFASVAIPAAITCNFTHFAFQVHTLPTGSARAICGSLAAGVPHLRITPTGALQYFVNTTQIGSDTTITLAVDTWYWIGFRQSAGTGVDLIQINSVVALNGTNTGAVPANTFGPQPTSFPAIDCYYDDVVIDSAGFVTEKKVVLLKPISDNARATLWTGGAGGTTSLFDAVDNNPPAGLVSASATNTSQIEHAGGAAGTTDAYDANMTSYSTAGLVTGDTVDAIQYQIVHGEDIATGTKLLNFSLVSNPTQASGLANFDVNPSSAAVGSYTTNWRATKNTLVLSPSVTLGTSPVMRVVRPETATRVASCCFMGMYVVYTPAPPAPPNPRGSVYPQLLAH